MITSFRMYGAGPLAARAWRALFTRVFTELGVDVEVIEHRWPAPIAQLWSEPELCCAFMCGWPWVRGGRAMRPIAAPVPSPARYDGLPRYCSEFLAREASGWRSLEDSFGNRFGWMAEDSQSGFNAPRSHLAQYLRPDRPGLFSEVRGPLGTPATTLEALRSGEVDVVAIDCFYLDLLRRHEPAKLRGIGCIATTGWTPIPLLVAAPGIDAGVVARIRDRLLGLHESPEYVALLADVLVARFVVPEPAAYDALDAAASFAAGRGYTTIR